MLRLDSQPSSCSTAITIVAAALMGLGVVMVFSASASLTAPPITENTLQHSAVRHAGFTCLALVTLLIVSLVPYRSWRIRQGAYFQPAILLLIVTVILLGLALIPGVGEERHGARRWISLGPASLGLGFQPSELAKLAIVVFTAGLCARLGERLRKFWTGFLPTVILLGVVVGLVGIEDFGTALLLLIVGCCILVAGRARLWHLILISLPAVAALVHLIVSKPYRVERLTTFLDPYADPQGAGYHQIQSLVSIASGNWWGRGLGASIQKYGYLPEGRNDFIYAVICEELGIIGGIAIIGLFAVLLWQGRRAMIAAPDAFARYVALGATMTIGCQAAMNIAVVTVSVPTKGISLPFVSAGGSGVVFFSVLVGILVNIARYRRLPVARAFGQRKAEPPGKPTTTGNDRDSSPPVDSVAAPA